MSLISKLIVTTLPFVPKPIVGFFARPYIAGEKLGDGIRVVRELNARGIMATMDVLGEDVKTREEVMDMRRQCEEVLHAIHANRLDSNLSVKPTQMGLSMDERLCEENLRALLDIAKGYGNFIRIDMEDHPFTEQTVALYKRLRCDYRGHVGIVLQAYLRRTADDLKGLVEDGPTNIRLCKGIYVEPEAIAFKKRGDVQDSFKALLEYAIPNGVYVGIATHDDVLLNHALDLVKKRGLKREDYEFQMLLGVRVRRRDEIVQMGHRLRVYVPFGDRWYAYSTRRLKENPSVAMHIVKAIFGIGQ